MSGFRSQKVWYNDPWDCGKQTSEEEPYQLESYGTSDTIEFRRKDQVIASLSKGDAWLFMKALEHLFSVDDPHMLEQPNPFSRESRRDSGK